MAVIGQLISIRAKYDVRGRDGAERKGALDHSATSARAFSSPRRSALPVFLRQKASRNEQLKSHRSRALVSERGGDSSRKSETRREIAPRSKAREPKPAEIRYARSEAKCKLTRARSSLGTRASRIQGVYANYVFQNSSPVYAVYAARALFIIWGPTPRADLFALIIISY